MRRTFWTLAPVVAALVFVLVFCAALAHASAPPTQTVERLSFVREAVAEKGTSFRLLTVKCAATSTRYMYVCNFLGANAGKRLCAATYVHYHPGHDGNRFKVNFWGQAWQCGAQPPYAPPKYPGDSTGPSS